MFQRKDASLPFLTLYAVFVVFDLMEIVMLSVVPVRRHGLGLSLAAELAAIRSAPWRPQRKRARFHAAPLLTKRLEPVPDQPRR